MNAMATSPKELKPDSPTLDELYPPPVPPPTHRRALYSASCRRPDGGRSSLSAGRTRGTPRDQTSSALSDREDRALKRIFAHKCLTTRLEAVAPASSRSMSPTSSPPLDGFRAGASDLQPNYVIEEFLGRIANDEGCDLTAWTARQPLQNLLTCKGADRVLQEFADLKSKLARVERDNKKLLEQLSERDDRIQRLEDDLDRLRKDPQALHPAMQRLRKMGLNTQALAALGDRWAGYVLGRTSLAMEVGSYAFRSVFANHAVSGILTEESFKNVIKQFEPVIKSDQLTRLWFFADSDGSGRLDLFEFMRMFGCDANGDMSDEYFELVTINMYRKFQRKGGVRRAYGAFADKNPEQPISVQDWIQFLSNVKLGDMELTKQEMVQVFHRMNVSSTGQLLMSEIEAVIQKAASKCSGSDKWVRETFNNFAKMIQDKGVNIRQLFQGSTMEAHEFRTLMNRFMPSLRKLQLDRLWKFMLQELSEDGRPKLQSELRDCIDVEGFLSVTFGQAFSIPDAVAHASGQVATFTENGELKRVVDAYGPPGGTGREALEQLVGVLLDRVGTVPLEACFNVMDPFLTPDHFHEALVAKLGLQYDMMKANQLFSLIDIDRDGKLTRYEFLNLFRLLAPNRFVHHAECEPSAKVGAEDTSGHETKHANDAGEVPFSDTWSRVFEKKIKIALEQTSRERLTAHDRNRRDLGLTWNDHGKPELSLIPEIEDFPLQIKVATPESFMANLEDNNEQTQIRRLLNRVHVMERELAVLKSNARSDMTMVPEKQYQQVCLAYSKLIQSCRDKQPVVKISSLCADSKYVSVDEELDFHERIDSATKDQDVSPPAHGIESKNDLAMQEVEGQVTSRARSVDSDKSQGVDSDASLQLQTQLRLLLDKTNVLEEDNLRLARDCQTRVEALEEEIRMLRTYIDFVGGEQLQDESRHPSRGTCAPKNDEAEISSARSSIFVRCETGQSMNGSAPRPSMMKVRSEKSRQGIPYFPDGQVNRAMRLWSLGPGKFSMREHLRHLQNGLEHAILDGRYRIDSLRAASEKVVTVLCHDLIAGMPAIAKLSNNDRFRKELAYEACVLAVLSNVPHVPTMHHFSGEGAWVAFSVAELLQGETLASRFLSVQNGGDPITTLEAAEIADSLLRGVDLCHQKGLLHLSLCPDTVWISPPLSGSRVHLIGWGTAEPIEKRNMSPEFLCITDRRRRDHSDQRMPPIFHFGQDGTIFPNSLNGSQHGSRKSDTKTRKPFPSFTIENHGCLYYLSTAQLYNFLLAHENDKAHPPTWEWATENSGDVARVLNSDVHWPEKGEAHVQTAMPVALVPMGHLFEVDILKAMTVVRKASTDLGFRIGITRDAPSAFTYKDQESDHDNSVFCGGDCAYYIHGERYAASPDPPRDSGGAIDPAAYALYGNRYLAMGGGLRKGDRVGLLVDWNGDLQVFRNYKLIGVCPKVFEPKDTMQRFYGVVDLYAHENEEHIVRAVTLTTNPDDRSSKPFQGATADRTAKDLESVHQLLHMPASSVLGPACDVFACAMILMQCFRGGYTAHPPAVLERVQIALETWATDGCPKLSNTFYLLVALKDMLSAKELDLHGIENVKVHSVLSRAVKRSRYSRLTSCSELAVMLNAATNWVDMTPEFLHSHELAVEQAAHRHNVDMHYIKEAMSAGDANDSYSSDSDSDLGEDEEEESSVSAREIGDGAGSVDSADGARDANTQARSRGGDLQGGAVKQFRVTQGCEFSQPHAVWDLSCHALCCSHITRVVQVLTAWSSRDHIKAVAVARFASDVPEELQKQFLKCFDTEGQETRKMAGQRQSEIKGKRGRKSLKARLRGQASYAASGALRNCEKPKLMLDDIILPTKSLPAKRYLPYELIERNALWLATLLVQELELPGDSCVLVNNPVELGRDVKTMSMIAGCMARSAVLTQVNLASNSIGEIGAGLLAESVVRCPKLHTLDLNNNSMGPTGAHKIMVAVVRGRSVTYLDLSRNGIGDVGTQLMAEPLANATTLRELRLRINGIGIEGGEALSSAMMMNVSLRELHLSGNSIPAEVIASILRVTATNKTLCYLDLDNNLPWPSYEGNECLLQSIFDPLMSKGELSSNVECLCLRHCGVRSACAAKLFAALSTNRFLKRLNMSWNGLHREGCEEIVSMLASPTSVLTELDLRDNQLGFQDVLPFALHQAFAAQSTRLGYAESHVLGCTLSSPRNLSGHAKHKSNISLRSLNLANNEISETGAALLSESFLEFKCLEELYLYHNPDIGDVGLHTLMQLLIPFSPEQPPTMRVLNLASCSLGDLSCRAIGKAIQVNESVVDLDLSCNSIEHISPLAEALACNRTLQNLCLTMNYINLSSKRALVAAVYVNGKSGIRSVDVSAQWMSTQHASNQERIARSNQVFMMKFSEKGNSKFDWDVSPEEFMAQVGRETISLFIGLDDE